MHLETQILKKKTTLFARKAGMSTVSRKLRYIIYFHNISQLD